MVNRLLVAVGRACLWLFGLACFGAVAVASRKLHGHALTPLGVLLAYALPPLIGAVAIWLALRLPGSRVSRLLTESAALGVSVLIIECGLTVFASVRPSIANVGPGLQLERARIAAKMHLPFDLRTKSQAVADLRAHGIDAYPEFSRDALTHPNVKARFGDGLYPLSQVASSRIVECNESGTFQTFVTDEYGFNNPPGLYAAGHPTIAAVGSSYTLGHCVPGIQGFMHRVREQYPRTLNFGMAGSHVLTMLATMREYVEPLRPPLVLWVMYPNAMETGELRDPILRSYLQPDFSQHLLERRAQVDQMLRRNLVEVQLEADAKQDSDYAASQRAKWRRILHFSELRERMNESAVPTLKSLMFKPGPLTDFSQTQTIIALARDKVASWGGQLVVVLIPTFEEVVAKQIPPDRSNERILSLLQPLGVHVINGVPLLRAQSDPAAFYNLRSNNHLNEAGHLLLGNYVIADLASNYPQLTAVSK
jgi:hypothetical protein